MLISLDVASLFTTIPLDLAILILDENSNYVVEPHWQFHKQWFMKTVTFKSNYFSFEGRFYQLTFANPMGSSLSPILTSLWQRPSLVKTYVVVLRITLGKQNKFNGFNQYLQSTIEEEVDNSTFFLDTNNIRNGTLIEWTENLTV